MKYTLPLSRPALLVPSAVLHPCHVPANTGGGERAIFTCLYTHWPGRTAGLAAATPATR